MALPGSYRAIVRNNTGGVISNTKVEVTPYRFNESTGQIEYGTPVDLTPAADPADGEFAVSASPVASNAYIGLKGSVYSEGAGSGNVELFLEWPRSTGQYPSDALTATDSPAAFAPQLASMPVVAGGREANYSYE